jgi:hypothetical protein
MRLGCLLLAIDQAGGFSHISEELLRNYSLRSYSFAAATAEKAPQKPSKDQCNHIFTRTFRALWSAAALKVL